MAKRRKSKENEKVKKTVNEGAVSSILDWLHLLPNEFSKTTAEVCEFRAILTENGKISKKQAIKEHQKRIDTMEKMVQCEEKNFDENEKMIADVNAEIEVAKEELRKAREILQKKEEIQRKLIRKREFIEAQLQQGRKTIKILKEARSDMNNVILVHTSASVNQLRQYQAEDIIVSKTDSAFFFGLEKRTDGIFSIDGVFNSDENENFVSELPSNFFYKYSPTTAKSIIDYCEMAISIKLREDNKHKVILLFNNTDIAEILKLNGMV